eukprot:SAG31_NODE_1728_length_7428_cov_2.495975_7_plen_94_part_00
MRRSEHSIEYGRSHRAPNVTAVCPQIFASQPDLPNAFGDHGSNPVDDLLHRITAELTSSMYSLAIRALIEAPGVDPDRTDMTKFVLREALRLN